MTHKEVDSKTIDTILKEYPESMTMLNRIDYHGELAATGYFKVAPNWSIDDKYVSGDSSEAIVGHFTASEGVFSHNQFAYTFTTYLLQEGEFDNIRPISLEAMNDKKFNLMVLTNLEFKFNKSFVSTEEYTCDFRIAKSKLKQTRSGIYLFKDFEFSFAGGKCVGRSCGATRIDPSEIIDMYRVEKSKGL